MRVSNRALTAAPKEAGTFRSVSLVPACLQTCEGFCAWPTVVTANEAATESPANVLPLLTKAFLTEWGFPETQLGLSGEFAVLIPHRWRGRHAR